MIMYRVTTKQLLSFVIPLNKIAMKSDNKYIYIYCIYNKIKRVTYIYIIYRRVMTASVSGSLFVKSLIVIFEFH